jgi:apolipoprotein D and lipocalin family protein
MTLNRFAAGLLLWASAAAPASAPAQAPALQPLPSLDVASYMGTWYQVLWIPNRFQKQCVSDTAATYRDLGNGTVEVTNRCRLADGTTDSVVGAARPPAGVSRIQAGQLMPARLEVSFLPRWLRWTGIGWGAYWVVELAPDGRYVIISEATREYLWVLARRPALTSEDDVAIKASLTRLGFDLAKVQAHPHNTAPQAANTRSRSAP